MSFKTVMCLSLSHQLQSRRLGKCAVGSSDLHHGSTVLKSVFEVNVFILKARKGVWKLIIWQQKKGSFFILRSKFTELAQCLNSQQKESKLLLGEPSEHQQQVEAAGCSDWRYSIAGDQGSRLITRHSYVAWQGPVSMVKKALHRDVDRLDQWSVV